MLNINHLFLLIKEENKIVELCWINMLLGYLRLLLCCMGRVIVLLCMIRLSTGIGDFFIFWGFFILGDMDCINLVLNIFWVEIIYGK